MRAVLFVTFWYVSYLVTDKTYIWNYSPQSAYTHLGKGVAETAKSPSTASLLLLAYLPLEDFAANLSNITPFLPILVASMQTNHILDESIAFLLKFLHCSPNGDLSPEVVVPLLTVLPSLASGHPDGQTRHQVFRVLSLVLSRTPSPLRLETLASLTAESEFPQMRVAAVGLVKEALIQALSQGNSAQSNVFASPAFLRVFGPILFRSDPPDLFTAPLSIEDFEESHESKRLVECLSLLYVLLQRDEKNSVSLLFA